MLHQFWCQAVLCLAAHFHHLPVSERISTKREMGVKNHNTGCQVMSHYHISTIRWGCEVFHSQCNHTSSWQNVTAQRDGNLGHQLFLPVNNQKQNEIIVMSSFLASQSRSRQWPGERWSTWIRVWGQWNTKRTTQPKLTADMNASHCSAHFPFLITSRQTFGDIHFLDPQLQSVCSFFVCCSQSLWMIWTSFKGTTESPVGRKRNWADCLAWMHGLIFHALWGASAALATVAEDEQLVVWPVNQSKTHPIKESSPNWFPPSTIAWDSEVRGSFFCGVCVEEGQMKTMIRLVLKCKLLQTKQMNKKYPFLQYLMFKPMENSSKTFHWAVNSQSGKRKRAFWAKEENTDV